MPFTQNPTPTFAKQPRLGAAQILPADASNLKALVTAGSNGSKVVAIHAASTDTSGRDLQLLVTRSAVNYILGTTTVGALAGNAGGTPAVDLLSTTNFPTNLFAVDHDGQHYLNLESGDVLNVKSLTTVTTAKEIDILAEFEDF